MGIFGTFLLLEVLLVVILFKIETYYNYIEEKLQKMSDLFIFDAFASIFYYIRRFSFIGII